MTRIAFRLSVCLTLVAGAACGTMERKLEGRLFFPDFFSASIVTNDAMRAPPMSSQGISVIGLAVRETHSFDIVDGRKALTVDVYETDLGSCFAPGRISSAFTEAIERTPGYSVIDVSDEFEAVIANTTSDWWTGMHAFTEGDARATDVRNRLRTDHGLDAILLIDEVLYIPKLGGYPDAKNGKGIRARSSKDNHLYAYFTVRAFNLATGAEIEGSYFNQATVWHLGTVGWTEPPTQLTNGPVRDEWCRKFRLLDENNMLWAMKKLKLEMPAEISLPPEVKADLFRSR